MQRTKDNTFSIRLRPEVRKRLEKLAKESGRSRSFLAADAVEVYLEEQERRLEMIRQAEREIGAGHYVKHEDMKAWLLSWGGARELSPPPCACGKAHEKDMTCA